MPYFLLTRKDHDRLHDLNRPLLLKLFTKYNRKWSLAGVTFYNVSSVDVAAINAALKG